MELKINARAFGKDAGFIKQILSEYLNLELIIKDGFIIDPDYTEDFTQTEIFDLGIIAGKQLKEAELKEA